MAAPVTTVTTDSDNLILPPAHAVAPTPQYQAPTTAHCRVLVVGDPHFKLTNITDTAAMTISILAHARLYQPHIIVVLGDILDRFETIHISPFTRATRFLTDCLDIADTYLLIGNHDLKNKNQYLSPDHPFLSGKYWHHPHHRFTVVDNVVTETIVGQDLSVQMSFLPYVPPGMFEMALNSNSDLPAWQSSRVIFAHQEFYGANFEVGSSTEGDKWPLNYPLVISGHIHDYHRLQDNILYVGTPIQHGYDDRIDKTISMITFTAQNWQEQRITLEVRKKTIHHISVAQVGTYQVSPEEIAKIVISGTSAELKGINRHPAWRQWTEQGHKVTTKTLPGEHGRLSTAVVSIKDGVRPGFRGILHSKLAAQPHLRDLYLQIFGPNA